MLILQGQTCFRALAEAVESSVYLSWFRYCKVMILKGQCHKLKTNGTIGFLDLKNTDLDAKIVIVSALVQKYGQRRLFV